ncbi:PREDICTED: uncharacterized protein LOC109227955 [Nicotiana attenuata]|uniref:uncharacterized protein LOC109227955 n=1 Tax=Nicotiana attenuata TaxID=49451 RepID=UPI0009052CE2|nr:PREDICTED: uncharacterized protein LOC109227955 [Nicotiana attenuata]
MEARKTIKQLPEVNQRQSAIKQIYLGLLRNHNKVVWRSLMFHNEARPKAVFTMWIQCHGRMLTADRLTKWGIQVNPRCSLCNNADESHMHLFGECSFSRAVWCRLRKWLQMCEDSVLTGIHMVTWVIVQAKGKSCKARIVKMIYVEYVYGI